MSQAEDPLIDCPLDNVHRIRTSRLQFHLVRCLKNHKLSASSKVKCPFNPLHIVEAVEIMHHCQSCPDSATVLLEQFDLEGEKCYSGVIGFDELRRQLDANMPENPNREMYIMNNPGYDPNENIENKPVYRIMMCESKSKRQEFRMRERQRFAALDQNIKLPKIAAAPEVPEVQKSLRQPFHVPQESNAMVTESQVFDSKQSTSSSCFSSKPTKESEKIDVASTSNSDMQDDDHIEYVTDIINKLDISNRKEYSIREKKNKFMNLIAPSNEKPSKNIISYRDAAKGKSADASCSHANNKNVLQPKINQKCAANFNFTNGKSETASHSGLRLPHSVDSSLAREQ